MISYFTNPIMIKIGKTNDKNTACSSCFGFLIGPAWSSSCAVAGLLSLMVSSKSRGH